MYACFFNAKYFIALHKISFHKAQDELIPWKWDDRLSVSFVSRVTWVEKVVEMNDKLLNELLISLFIRFASQRALKP